MEQLSFVKACQQFFSEGEHGRKVEISEFKELTTNDKLELSTMLQSVVPHEQYTGDKAAT